MGGNTDMNRRKFMQIGICTISGAMTLAGGAVLARFAIGPSFDRERPQWI